MNNQTITLTFCEAGENHHGMEIIGNKLTEGLTRDNLEDIAEDFDDTEIIDMSYRNQRTPESIQYNGDVKGSILIIRNGLKQLGLSSTDLWNEQMSIDYDKKAYMRGRVVNKRARWNLLFADYSQTPDYENKKGTIWNFSDLPELDSLRDRLTETIGKHGPLSSDTRNLIAESNYYYDNKKCYIGYHGDTERSVVIGVRLGDTFPLFYQWYYRSKPVSEEVRIDLNDGDIYIMDHKAVGTDWRRRIIPTLRHRAGEYRPKK